MKIVVIGGVAAGASAAVRARRMDDSAEIVLLEKGPYVSFANCGLPYYVGGDIPYRDDLLLVSPELFKNRFHVEVRLHHEVTAIDRANRKLRVIADGREYEEPYDKLILAPGCRPVVPPIPGIEKALPAEEVLENVEKVKGDVVVMGAGLVGLELAIWLAQLGHKVTIVEMADRPGIDIRGVAFMYYGITMDRLGVDLRLSTKAVAVNDGSLTVETAEGSEEIPTDTVICAVGEKPLAEEADALAFCAPEFHLIGDCIRPGNVLAATRQAYAVARNIGRV